MDPKDKEEKARIEATLEEHYQKVVNGMIRWCLFEQDETLETMVSTFGVDRKKILKKCINKAIDKWGLKDE